MYYNLTKKAFTGAVFVSPSYVSDGHIVVRKSSLKNAAIFSSGETARAALRISDYSRSDFETDEPVEKALIPGRKNVEYTRTMIKVQMEKTTAIIYKNCRGIKAIDEKIAKNFDIDTFTSDDNSRSILWNEEMGVGIMPLRLGASDDDINIERAQTLRAVANMIAPEPQPQSAADDDTLEIDRPDIEPDTDIDEDLEALEGPEIEQDPVSVRQTHSNAPGKPDNRPDVPLPPPSTDADTRRSKRPVVKHNQERGGIEIRFPGKPIEEIRAWMKARRFRWSKFQKIWYARYNPDLFRETVAQMELFYI